MNTITEKLSLNSPVGLVPGAEVEMKVFDDRLSVIVFGNNGDRLILRGGLENGFEFPISGIYPNWRALPYGEPRTNRLFADMVESFDLRIVWDTLTPHSGVHAFLQFAGLDEPVQIPVAIPEYDDDPRPNHMGIIEVELYKQVFILNPEDEALLRAVIDSVVEELIRYQEETANEPEPYA